MIPFWNLKLRNYEMRLKILEVMLGFLSKTNWKLFFVSTTICMSGLQASRPWACLCTVLLFSNMLYESLGHTSWVCILTLALTSRVSLTKFLNLCASVSLSVSLLISPHNAYSNLVIPWFLTEGGNSISRISCTASVLDVS